MILSAFEILSHQLPMGTKKRSRHPARYRLHSHEQPRATPPEWYYYTLKRLTPVMELWVEISMKKSDRTETERMRTIMRDHELSIGARLLWWELTQWVTEDINVCYPTQKQLADNLGVHRNSVVRWIRELKDVGVLGYDLHTNDRMAYSLFPCGFYEL